MTEVALASVALASGVALGNLGAEFIDIDSTGGLSPDAYNRKVETLYTTVMVSTWALLGTGLVGIVQAQWALKKGPEERSPKAVSTPSLVISSDGATVGFSGRF